MAGVVVSLLTVALIFGVTSPDGTVKNRTPTPGASTTSPTTSPTLEASPTTTAPPTASSDLAPASVAETWPGLFAGAEVQGDRVDWCGSFTIAPSDDATATFGQKEVDKAACAAVEFVFEHRYSRLSLPRDEYRRSDFDAAAKRISAATRAAGYQQRIADFVANPSSRRAERLGLVLFTEQPGDGFEFYGPADSDAGYEGRAVWINPTISEVTVRVDRAKARPRLVVSFDAAAAVPVFDARNSADAMMMVPTDATLTMRQDGSDWSIGGFDISTGNKTFDPLAVNAP